MGAPSTDQVVSRPVAPAPVRPPSSRPSPAAAPATAARSASAWGKRSRWPRVDVCTTMAGASRSRRGHGSAAAVAQLGGPALGLPRSNGEVAALGLPRSNGEVAALGLPRSNGEVGGVSATASSASPTSATRPNDAGATTAMARASQAHDRDMAGSIAWTAHRDRSGAVDGRRHPRPLADRAPHDRVARRRRPPRGAQRGVRRRADPGGARGPGPHRVDRRAERLPSAGRAAVEGPVPGGAVVAQPARIGGSPPGSRSTATRSAPAGRRRDLAGRRRRAPRGGVHPPRARRRETAICNDAFMNLPDRLPGVKGALVRLLGSTGGPKVTWTARVGIVDDRRAWADHLRRLAARPALARMVPGHGAIVTDDAGAALPPRRRRAAPPRNLGGASTSNSRCGPCPSERLAVRTDRPVATRAALRPLLDDVGAPHRAQLRARSRGRPRPRAGQAAPGVRAAAPRVPLGQRSLAPLRPRRHGGQRRRVRRGRRHLLSVRRARGRGRPRPARRAGRARRGGGHRPPARLLPAAHGRRRGAQLDARLEEVDGCGLLPLAAHGRAFATAASFRWHWQKLLGAHLAMPAA
jgi:hypothetical protein